MQEQEAQGGRGLAPAMGGIVLGTALQLQQARLWEWQAYAVLGLAALVAHGFLALKREARGRSGGLLLTAAAIGFAAVGLRAGIFMQGALDPSLEGRDIAITGFIAAMPQPTDGGTRLRVAVESARLDGADVRLPSQLQLGWYQGAMPAADGTPDLQRASPGFRPGEYWRMTVRLKAPHGQSNPGGFDYELWLWEQGVQATGYVRAGRKDPAPERIAATWRYPVEQLRHAVRERIYERVADRRMAGVLAALVVGDQGAIDRADWDVFRATGVAHLMSISGLHVTMFAWLAAALIGAMWRRSARACLAVPAQHAALVGGLLLAAGYALFSGGGVPSQRTVWMLAVVGLLRLSGRQWPWPWVWLLACTSVVLVDPWAMLQAGFWLSFVAVGVLFATDTPRHPRGGGDPVTSTRPGSRWIPAFAGMTGRLAGMTGRLAGMAGTGASMAGRMLREQGIVTLALTPLTLLLFGQFSVVGLVANLVAIPWVTLAVTPLALAGAIAPPVWDAAAGCVQVLAAVLGWLAALPFATISVAAPPLWAAAAGVAGGLLLVLPWPWQARVLGVPLLLPVLLWQPERPPPGQFDLLAADIGQGNAVIVRTAAHTLVYDTGPRYSRESDAGHRVLVPLLRQMGERVDTLVLSHRDSDHTGGAAAVLAMQPQAALLGSIEAGHELQALRPVTRCEAGQHWEWDGVRFDVLHPPPGEPAAGVKPNATSCVLRIADGTASALLVGDIEAPQEAALAPSIAKADVLLVPHHGSKTSSSDAFLDAVHPRIALVQAGWRNRFGHPAAPVVARYLARGAAVFDSASCGAARWRSAQPAAVDCERERAKYWHHRPQPAWKLLS